MDDNEAGLRFPDTPRSELDRALETVVESARRVLETQGRLRALLAATTAVNEGLDLSLTLQRITHAAMDLVGARFGALGIVDDDGTLEQFIHVGMSETEAASISHLPEGHGLLGAVIAEQSAIRLAHLSHDPRSEGFPDHHPHMESFLGVPIRVRERTYGNLYLTERRDGPFTEEDQELVTALAASAGVAIENARLFERSRRRQAWTRASAAFSGALLSGDVERAVLELAESCVEIHDAALVCVVVPDGDELRVQLARGALAEHIQGVTLGRAGTLAGAAIDTGRPVIETKTRSHDLPVPLDLGPAMALPLRATPEGIPGAITVARAPGASRFEDDDLDMAADFADQASIALELRRSMIDRQRMNLLDERNRIARDLHDLVIQRLFATGLSLQSTASHSSELHVRERVIDAVAQLDSTIDDIRTAIFAMSARSTAALRRRIIDLAGEYSKVLEFSPKTVFAGPVDLVSDEELADDVVAVVREGLSNAARHAHARSAEVRVQARNGEMIVTVRDDGVGIPDHAARSSGLENLRARARARGGAFTAKALAGGGTEIRWAAPAHAIGEDTDRGEQAKRP